MRVFYNTSTQYYERVRRHLYDSLVTSPALGLVSKVDPVGTVEAITGLFNAWENKGMEVKIQYITKVKIYNIRDAAVFILPSFRPKCCIVVLEKTLHSTRENHRC